MVLLQFGLEMKKGGEKVHVNERVIDFLVPDEGFDAPASGLI